MATENSTLKICANHFYKKQTAKLFEVNGPDWVPSVNLEHSEILFKSSISRCERRKKRALKRSSQKTADQKTMNDKAKRNNEVTAGTSDTPEQFQAVENQPISSMSLKSVATQTESNW